LFRKRGTDEHTIGAYTIMAVAQQDRLIGSERLKKLVRLDD